MMDASNEKQSGGTAAENAALAELTPEEKEFIYAKARNRARFKLSLYIHAAVYLVVMLLLLFINLTTASSTFWVVWPLFGWGAGLAIHWVSIIKLVPFYESIKEKEIARQLEIRQDS